MTIMGVMHMYRNGGVRRQARIETDFDCILRLAHSQSRASWLLVFRALTVRAMTPAA
jgi:hypothetical protein